MGRCREEVGFRGRVKTGILWPLNMAKRIDGVSSVSQLCVTCTLCGLSSSSLGTLPPGSSQRNGMSLSVFNLARKVSRQGCPHLNTSCVQALVYTMEELWGLQVASGTGVWRSQKRKDSLEMSGPPSSSCDFPFQRGPPSVSLHCFQV